MGIGLLPQSPLPSFPTGKGVLRKNGVTFLQLNGQNWCLEIKFEVLHDFCVAQEIVMENPTNDTVK